MILALQIVCVFFISAVLGALIGWGVVSLVMRYFGIKEWL